MNARATLDNIFWHALTGPHAKFASGSGGVRRYAKGFSPIVAFENPREPDFRALAAVVDAGEAFYCAEWSGTPPAGWRVDVDASMFLMVWGAAMPDEVDVSDIVPLGREHDQQAFDLAALTRPGPFGPRTPELGEYFGIFDGEQLIAMTGERTQAPGFREVSGVCTHPSHQGRGLARRLVSHVVRREMQRGETPVLHVMSSNTAARTLYERMGFAVHRESVVRVMVRE
jgi:ribosomal protein S18 acetylase RimI-like enzyme